MTVAKLARLGGPPALSRQERVQGLGRWPEVRDEDVEAVVAVLRSAEEPYGFLHPEVVALQQEFASAVNQPFCLAVSSGTAALHLAIAALGLQPGDEVITPALGYIASAACILHHNCIPVFVDIRPDTFNLDPAALEAAITPRTRAILAVDLLGLPADYEAIRAIAGRRGLAIIQDASHSQGAQYKGRPACGMGDVSAMSVMATKNLAAAGEGGLITTADEAIAARILGHASMGMNLWGRAKEDLRRISFQLGFNYRPTPTSVAFLRRQLARLPHYQEARQVRARIFTDCLAEIPFLRAPVVPAGLTHGWQMYRVVVDPQPLGLDPAWAPYLRDAVVFLLRGEGGAVGFWEDEILPAMPVFQRGIGYGGGCPWSCRAEPRPDYSPARFPVAQHILDASFMTPVTRATHDLEFVHNQSKPYRKLADHTDIVVELTRCIADAGGFAQWAGVSIREERALRDAKLDWESS